LSDTVDNFINIAKMDLAPGQHKVVHNYTLRLSISGIAKAIKEIDGDASIARINNPRKEAYATLRKEVEVHSAVQNSHKNKEAKFKEDLLNLIEFVGRYENNIDASVIMPKILWEKDQKLSRKTFPVKKSSLIMRQ
jgi:UDP-sulfoquinovose synthase